MSHPHSNSCLHALNVAYPDDLASVAFANRRVSVIPHSRLAKVVPHELAA